MKQTADADHFISYHQDTEMVFFYPHETLY